MNVTVVAGSPSRKLANGVVPCAGVGDRTARVATVHREAVDCGVADEVGAHFEAVLTDTQVRVSPKVTRFWSSGRSVLRPPFAKVANVRLKLIAGCPKVASSNAPTTARRRSILLRRNQCRRGIRPA